MAKASLLLFGPTSIETLPTDTLTGSPPRRSTVPSLTKPFPSARAGRGSSDWRHFTQLAKYGWRNLGFILDSLCLGIPVTDGFGSRSAGR